jgi:hypothetical protein
MHYVYHVKICSSFLLKSAIKYCNLHKGIVHYLWKMTREICFVGVKLSKLTI